MNRNEFYKNLMLNYTVDTEKVKRIAKRRVVKRSSKVLRIIPGAAACAAVTAAAVTIVSLGAAGRDPGVDIIADEAAVARMAAAEQYYVSLPDDDAQLMDLYVSFEHSLSYNEILLSFSKIDEKGDINISLLYTDKGKYYENSESLAEELTFLGAKITAPAELCRDIRLLTTVSLVELPESGITDDSFSPFGSSEFVVTTPEPANTSFEIDLPSYTTTTTTTANADTTTNNTTTNNTTTAATTSETTTVTTTDTEETTTPPDTETETEETTTEVTADTSEDDTTIEEIPTDIDIPVAGVTSVNIINAERIVVTTNDSIRLYRLQEGALSLDTTFYVSNAKINWRSYDGTDLLITACEGGARTRLYWADGKAGALTELDVSAITSDGAEISSLVRTPDGRITLLKTVTTDKSRLYSIHRADSTLSINLIGEYDFPVTSLALIGDNLYFALTDTKNSTVGISVRNLADGTVTELASYSGTLRCTRSQTFNSAALTFTSAEGEETCVLLTPDGDLVETELSGISFAPVIGRIITDGKHYYYLSGGEVNLISLDDDVAAAFAPAPTPGKYTYVIQEDGSAYLMLKAE